jgi:hypothetical protein
LAQKILAVLFLIEPSGNSARHGTLAVDVTMYGGCGAMQGGRAGVILELGAVSVGLVEGIRRARRSRSSVLPCDVQCSQHPADMDEVVGNDCETHPAMPARVPFLETTAKSVASLEQADAPFLSLAEPALLVALSTRRTWGTQEGYGNRCDSPLLRSRFVGGGKKIRRLSPCCARELADLISENLSLDAGSRSPVVPQTACTCFFVCVSGLPPGKLGSRRFVPRIMTSRRPYFEDADIS